MRAVALTLLGLVVLAVGCGEEARPFGDDSGVSEGSGGVQGSGGAASAGSGGAAGTGGAAGMGGAGGDPGRPLGAGCTEAAQCGSGTCTEHVCCEGPDTACTVCVGGYLVPRTDGAVCGESTCESDGTITNPSCLNGECVPNAQSCCDACGADHRPTAGCFLAPESGVPLSQCICNAGLGEFCR